MLGALKTCPCTDAAGIAKAEDATAIETRMKRKFIATMVESLSREMMKFGRDV